MSCFCLGHVYPNKMQSIGLASTDRKATLAHLREAIDAVANAGRGSASALATGWPQADVDGGALFPGALHEWFGQVHGGPVPSGDSRRAPAHWTPPLSVLVHLAARAQMTPTSGQSTESSAVLWIGRRVWPYGHALLNAATPLYCSSICVDARDADQRFWSIDVALRCGGGVVIADASGLSLALSRRLQLAAEAGGSLALLARPPWEERELSVAATRWRVRAVTARADAACWSIELARCKGSHARSSHAPAWTVERTDDGRLVSLSPGVADRPYPAALAS